MSNRKPLGLKPTDVLFIFLGAQQQGGNDFASAMYWRRKILAFDWFEYDTKKIMAHIKPTAPAEVFLQVKPSDLPRFYFWAERYVVDQNLAGGPIDALGVLADKCGQEENFQKVLDQVDKMVDEFEEEEYPSETAPAKKKTKKKASK